MEHLFQRASNNGNGNADQIGQYVVRTVDDNRVTEDSIELTIETGIPIPPHGRGKSTKRNRMDSPMISILMDMKKGESMLVPEKLVREVRASITIIRNHYKSLKKPIPQFTTRTTPESKGKKFNRRDMETSRPFRVWRG